jgi:hypothetical protein
MGTEDGILMFPSTNIKVSDRWISQRASKHAPMQSPDRLSSPEEEILLALWKLRGIGKNTIREEVLREKLTGGAPSEGLMDRLSNLQHQGFLERSSLDGQTVISLTPLGLALLRRIEEDRLQELR